MRRMIFSIALIIILGHNFTYSQQPEIVLIFQDLERYALDNSPRIQDIKRHYDIQLVERKIDLQWTNPELEVEVERLKDRLSDEKEEESAITVAKSITMPWIVGQEHSKWENEIKAAALEQRAQVAQTLAEIKAGYVQIRLSRQKTAALSHYSEILEDVSRVVSDRHLEGALSGLEQNLLQLSLFHYTSQMVSLDQERRLLEYDWKISMGIDPEQDIELPTEIGFFPVELDRGIESLVSAHPAVRSFEQRESATQKAIKLAKSGIFPGFEVSGGYKEAGENFRGAVIGLSLPLPLMSWNKPQVERETINLRQITMEKDITRKTMTAHIRQSFQVIDENAQILERFSDVDFIKKTLESSAMAYREGWISLNDLLNNIQIYAESINQYYDLLISYYQHLFFLESALDRVLVTL